MELLDECNSENITEDELRELRRVIWHVYKDGMIGRD